MMTFVNSQDGRLEGERSGDESKIHGHALDDAGGMDQPKPGCATKCTTTTFDWATVTPQLRSGHRHKSLFDKHKSFIRRHLQKVMSD
jgi:hypothetical protein